MKMTGFVRTAWIVTIFCVATTVASPAQTFTTLASFNYTNGSSPNALVQGPDGNFYGTTFYGGTAATCENLRAGIGCGAIFKVTPTGQITTLHIFCSKANCADGAEPVGNLVLGPNGNFYGVTEYGGNSTIQCIGCGTVFEISPGGKFTTLYEFCSQADCTDGRIPLNGLALAANGNFYGTTGWGGANNSGTIFTISPSGKFSTIYSFCAKTNCVDGNLPAAALLQASNGNLYGGTDFGGAYDEGVLFEISTGGKLNVLSSLRGAQPDPNTMIQAADGNLYGTTYSGGAYQGGTFFTMTPAGTLTYLYYFCPANIECGFKPTVGVVQATDGNFYGTTSAGGTNRPYGTMYGITSTGALNVLYNFCSQTNCTDGWDPKGLVQATDGNIYGVTAEGGTSSNCNVAVNSCGTVFRLSTGLAPFAEAAPNYGKPGSVAYILGNNLTGTTSVTFNGVPATFSVVSSTYIKATVPSGATTGTIEVTTPGGVLSSNVAFNVLP